MRMRYTTRVRSAASSTERTGCDYTNTDHHHKRLLPAMPRCHYAMMPLLYCHDTPRLLRHAAIAAAADDDESIMLRATERCVITTPMPPTLA